jgi:hypothetical protein
MIAGDTVSRLNKKIKKDNIDKRKTNKEMILNLMDKIESRI